MEITMKLVKTIICSALAVLAAAGALTGCSDNKPNSSQVSYTEYVTPEDFSTTDETKEKTTFKGTGKNSQLEVSASVYGKTYTLGKSTVEDMLGDGWQKSEDNWQKFPSDKKIPAHSVNIIAKNLYQGEGEDKRSLFISFRNITDKVCTTDKCALSKIEINGRYDTFLGEAGASLFGGKLDFKKCVDSRTFEAELGKLVSHANKTVEGYYYSTYYKYSFKIKDGSSYIVVRTDSDTGKLRNISASITLDAKYGSKK